MSAATSLAAPADGVIDLSATGPTVATVGYVAPGIEMVLHAMELLRAELPDLRYLVAGPTHPELARRDGERYRWCLEALADDLGLGPRVQFVDCVLGPREHGALMQSIDVAVAPYREREHSIERTISAALRRRRPVIATVPCVSALADRELVTRIAVDDDEACAAAIHAAVTAL